MVIILDDGFNSTSELSKSVNDSWEREGSQLWASSVLRVYPRVNTKFWIAQFLVLSEFPLPTRRYKYRWFRQLSGWWVSIIISNLLFLP